MRRSVVLLAVALLASCTPHPADRVITGGADADRWSYGGMVAVANPYAAKAAAKVLRAGGHAVDAAIAAHAVLGLVEPQSSGLGGGAFMLVYDRASERLVAFDGRETAPAGAHAEMFLQGGKPMGFVDAWQSGLAVGVPGTVALYEASHGAFGRLDLANLLAPAIELAERGFVVSPRLADFLEQFQDIGRLSRNPATAAYFFPGGKPLSAGDLRDNPDYARALSRIAAEGAPAFYEGSLAQEMVAAVRAEPNPGTLGLEDLAAYAVARRDPICAPAGAQRICSMPPPSSGLAQIMIVGLYDRFVSGTDEALEDERESAFVDAQRLAYADRDHYVADPGFVDVPTEDLINAAYLDARARQRVAPGGDAQPGDPGAVLHGNPILQRWGQDTTAAQAGTSHLSIVDRFGNAVSMTATVEAPFGSSRWAGGFLLNNQMTDFAREPLKGGRPVANTVAPGKRPRSSMSPVIVFDDRGQLLMLTGSPGGNSIVAYVAKTLVGVLRWGMTAQAAVDRANIVARGSPIRVETGVAGGRSLATLLSGLGYPVEEREGENSGLHVIIVTEHGLEGAADPRREGEVIAIPAVD